MLDFIDRIDILAFAVANAVAVIEKRRKQPGRDVAIAVDRCTEHCPAMLAVIGRIISSPAEERDAKGGAGDDHNNSSRGSNTSESGRRLL
jgi:hypothetical protein